MMLILSSLHLAFFVFCLLLMILIGRIGPKVVGRKIKKVFTHPFTRFISRKGIFYLIAIFVSLSLIFLIPRLIPGDPVDLMLAPSTTETLGGTSPIQGQKYSSIERLRATMHKYFGLDKPLYGQYIDFWNDIFHGNLGPSYVYQFRSVASVVSDALKFSLSLVVPILVISFFLGNWIGARAAFLRGKWNDLVYYMSLLISRMPLYWFGMILVYLLCAKSGLFPMGGWHSAEKLPNASLDFFLDMSKHYILPFLALFVGTTGAWTVGMRSMTIYEMDSDYMLYSQQLGFSKRKLRSYAQRNAILPQFTGTNLVLSSLIGQTMITEIVFGWPGIGHIAYKAVLNLDFPLILGTFWITVFVVLVGNFVIDILYGIVDPRIRTGYVGG